MELHFGSEDWPSLGLLRWPQNMSWAIFAVVSVLLPPPTIFCTIKTNVNMNGTPAWLPSSFISYWNAVSVSQLAFMAKTYTHTPLTRLAFELKMSRELEIDCVDTAGQKQTAFIFKHFLMLLGWGFQLCCRRTWSRKIAFRVHQISILTNFILW